MAVIFPLIIFFGVINLIRMTVFIVGSDIYSYRSKKTLKNKTTKRFYPFVSIIIPAHNEEKTVIRAISSIVRNKYPRYKRQIVVVDDGSTDKTGELVKKYIDRYNVKNINLVRQKNKGKAAALNRGLKKHATGEVVMCLDSDSYLTRDGLKNASSYFQDEKVVAVSANVKIIPSGTFLNLVQQMEYLISYQMKRAQTVFNIEYIIGGIGSTFRKSALKKVGYYDGNTVTEDIDLTMKLLQLGNKNVRVIYGADVVAHTESVLNIGDLIKQRFRWKWGRSQTFLKNTNMFFSRDKRFTKGLSFFYLPYAIFSDIAFLLEPALVSYIFYIILRYGDIFTLASSLTIISIYISLNIFLENTLSKKEKVKFILLSPLMYFSFYILSFVEYLALLKSLLMLPRLKQSILKNNYNWSHVSRLGVKNLK